MRYKLKKGVMEKSLTKSTERKYVLRKKVAAGLLLGALATGCSTNAESEAPAVPETTTTIELEQTTTTMSPTTSETIIDNEIVGSLSDTIINAATEKNVLITQVDPNTIYGPDDYNNIDLVMDFWGVYNSAMLGDKAMLELIDERSLLYPFMEERIIALEDRDDDKIIGTINGSLHSQISNFDTDNHDLKARPVMSISEGEILTHKLPATKPYGVEEEYDELANGINIAISYRKNIGYRLVSVYLPAFGDVAVRLKPDGSVMADRIDYIEFLLSQ